MLILKTSIFLTIIFTQIAFSMEVSRYEWEKTETFAWNETVPNVSICTQRLGDKLLEELSQQDYFNKVLYVEKLLDLKENNNIFTLFNEGKSINYRWVILSELPLYLQYKTPSYERRKIKQNDIIHYQALQKLEKGIIKIADKMYTNVQLGTSKNKEDFYDFYQMLNNRVKTVITRSHTRSKNIEDLLAPCVLNKNKDISAQKPTLILRVLFSMLYQASTGCGFMDKKKTLQLIGGDPHNIFVNDLVDIYFNKDSYFYQYLKKNFGVVELEEASKLLNINNPNNISHIFSTQYTTQEEKNTVLKYAYWYMYQLDETIMDNITENEDMEEEEKKEYIISIFNEHMKNLYPLFDDKSFIFQDPISQMPSLTIQLIVRLYRHMAVDLSIPNDKISNGVSLNTLIVPEDFGYRRLWNIFIKLAQKYHPTPSFRKRSSICGNYMKDILGDLKSHVKDEKQPIILLSNPWLWFLTFKNHLSYNHLRELYHQDKNNADLRGSITVYIKGEGAYRGINLDEFQQEDENEDTNEEEVIDIHQVHKVAENNIKPAFNKIKELAKNATITEQEVINFINKNLDISFPKNHQLRSKIDEVVRSLQEAEKVKGGLDFAKTVIPWLLDDTQNWTTNYKDLQTRVNMYLKQWLEESATANKDDISCWKGQRERSILGVRGLHKDMDAIFVNSEATTKLKASFNNWGKNPLEFFQNNDINIDAKEPKTKEYEEKIRNLWVKVVLTNIEQEDEAIYKKYNIKLNLLGTFTKEVQEVAENIHFITPWHEVSTYEKEQLVQNELGKTQNFTQIIEELNTLYDISEDSKKGIAEIIKRIKENREKIVNEYCGKIIYIFNKKPGEALDRADIAHLAERTYLNEPQPIETGGAFLAYLNEKFADYQRPAQAEINNIFGTVVKHYNLKNLNKEPSILQKILRTHGWLTALSYDPIPQDIKMEDQSSQRGKDTVKKFGTSIQDFIKEHHISKQILESNGITEAWFNECIEEFMAQAIKKLFTNLSASLSFTRVTNQPKADFKGFLDGLK